MPSSGGQTCALDRKSTRLNSSHGSISYAVFCLKKIDDTDLSHSYFIKTNQRLMAIKLESESALKNMLRKGDFVDIIGSDETKDNSIISLIIAQPPEFHLFPNTPHYQ